jgi:hypothetical protein
MTIEKRLLLSDICGEYFGITERIAQRKASLGLLPVPAFRLSGTRKGPLYVLQSHLDEHVKREIEKAEKLNSKMRVAGLV